MHPKAHLYDLVFIPGRQLRTPYTIVYDRAQPNTLSITVVHDFIRSIAERVTRRFGSYTTYS